jgi:hypothetical protein
MIVGKAGDTIKVRTTDTLAADKAILRAIDTNNIYISGDERMIRSGDGQLTSFRLQGADGVIETCKTAVNLCIGLIGIMALFMGFMSIAERAGGWDI